MATARTTHPLQGAARPGLGEAVSWIGSRVTDVLGGGIGRLQDVWVDPETGDPAWLLIREGRFGGGRHRLVPFDGATAGGGQVWLPFERYVIRTAPIVAPGDEITPELRRRVARHYS
jgi:hypothetical protein